MEAIATRVEATLLATWELRLTTLERSAETAMVLGRLKQVTRVLAKPKPHESHWPHGLGFLWSFDQSDADFKV